MSSGELVSSSSGDSEALVGSGSVSIAADVSVVTGPEVLVLVTVDELVTVVLPCVVETKDEAVDELVCIKTRAEVTAETKKKTKSKAFMLGLSRSGFETFENFRVET